MAGCCSTQGYDEVFTDRIARRDARRYLRKGLDGTARRMVGFLARRGIDGARVLDVGGGVGALGLELLKAGAASAMTVELTQTYEQAAADLVRQAGVGDRVERRTVDFAEDADELPMADVVVMHRVVCCYPDYERLLAAATARAGRLLVFSYPRSTWWSRAGSILANAVVRLRGSEFRSYIHPPAALLAAVERRGFRLAHDHEGLVWRVAGFERA